MNTFKLAKTDAPIQPRLAERYSPYGWDTKAVSHADLKSIFEAARWSPSSFNEQPWRYMVATRDEPDEYARLLSCLVEGNQTWAKSVPVLALGVTSLKLARNGKPNGKAYHDLGLATAFLISEAMSRGVYVHPMGGIVPERARELYQIPEDFDVVTGIALGYPLDPDALPDEWKARDTTPRTRRPVAQTVFSNTWGTPAFS